MPLEFRGLAIIDEPNRRIRFARYPIPVRARNITICDVSVPALLALAGKSDLSADELMGVFELHREAIGAIASVQFDAGVARPVVERKDLEALMP